MRVTRTRDDLRWRLEFLLDAEDSACGKCADGQPIELRTNSCHVRVPGSGPEPHGDLLAVAAWTVVAPWTKSRVTFNRPISARLAEALCSGWGVDAGPVAGDTRTGK